MKYVVGTLIGGLMEDPEMRIVEPYCIVEANSEKEAVSVYDEVNKSDYFYGSVIGHETEEGWVVTSYYTSKYQLESAVENAEVI